MTAPRDALAQLEAVRKPIPCPTTGESIALCRAWTDQHVEPSEYQPTLEGGVQTCDRCGMVRHFTREKK